MGKKAVAKKKGVGPKKAAGPKRTALARAIMSEKVLRDILSALAKEDVVPYNEMVSSLATATRKREDEIRMLYTDRYQQIKQVDHDPFGPPPMTVG